MATWERHVERNAGVGKHYFCSYGKRGDMEAQCTSIHLDEVIQISSSRFDRHDCVVTSAHVVDASNV